MSYNLSSFVLHVKGDVDVHYRPNSLGLAMAIPLSEGSSALSPSQAYILFGLKGYLQSFNSNRIELKDRSPAHDT